MEIDVQLDAPALGANMVLRAEGREAMNAIPEWIVDVLCNAEVADLDAVLRKGVGLSIVDAAEGAARTIPLVIAAIEKVANRGGRDDDQARYRLELRPQAHELTMRGGYRIFQEKMATEIVADVLQQAGISGDRVQFHLGGKYPKRLQCDQYGENDWAFIERLLAEEGISYWFDDEAGAPRLFFADRAESHAGIPGAPALPFAAKGNVVFARAFYELEREERVVVDRVENRDFDVARPDVPIEGHAGKDGAELVWFEYPADVQNNDMADGRATARLGELGRHAVRTRATSDCTRLQPGRVVSIELAPVDAMNAAYVVEEVRHVFRRPERSEAEGDRTPKTYTNEVFLLPGDAAVFPALPAKKRVEGVESAITTGAAGEEIHVDAQGRVKLRWWWDRSGVTDDKSSTWARTLQPVLSAPMFLPRVGWEVAVSYLDGLPHRPVVLGRIYNGTSVVPYGLPGASATSSFQSATSPGGGMLNEIRMGDDAGKEEFFVHASRDQSWKIGAGGKIKVGADDVHSIGLSLQATIGAGLSEIVGGSQTIGVAKDVVVKVKGSTAETIGALDGINVSGNRAVVADGLYYEGVLAHYGLECNQENTKVGSALIRGVGGNMDMKCGIGFGDTVAGGRAHFVNGNRSITVAKGYGDDAKGYRRVSVKGAATYKAGAKAGTSGISGTIEVGGAATISAGGNLTIKATSLTIDVSGTLTAHNLELSGGKLRAKGGTSEIKGDTKRPEAKVG